MSRSPLVPGEFRRLKEVAEMQMRALMQARTLLIGGLLAALVVTLAACGGSSGSSAADAQMQKEAALYQIDQIEKTWHKASSTHNVDLMMSLWAPGATFNVGTETLTGKAAIRKFFATKSAAFRPENHWESDTPAYKIKTTVNGDKGTIYFECHYVDVKTGKVMAVVGADQNLQKIGGKWLIVNSAGATPVLSQ
jgi:ketosteroid isomerase-like protein